MHIYSGELRLLASGPRAYAAALRALEAAGYVPMPVEPTPAMLHEAAKAMSPGRRPTPERVSVADKHRIRYHAMIAARPAVPHGGE